MLVIDGFGNVLYYENASSLIKFPVKYDKVIDREELISVLELYEMISMENKMGSPSRHLESAPALPGCDQLYQVVTRLRWELHLEI